MPPTPCDLAIAIAVSVLLAAGCGRSDAPPGDPEVPVAIPRYRSAILLQRLPLATCR